MSYPSLDKHLRDEGVFLERVLVGDDTVDEALHRAYIRAFKEDLPKGFSHVSDLVAAFRNAESDRVTITLDPSSEGGRQFVRLLGFDMPRMTLERYFGCAFGLYNCCKGVVAADREGLRLSLREQAFSQDPTFVDC